MATKLMILCDMHMIGNEEEVEGETIPPITLDNGTQRTVVLCEDCRGVITYSALIELAEEFGETPSRRTAKGNGKVTRATPDKGEIPEHEKSQCRFCERNDFRNQGRLMHERRSHAEEFAEAEAKEREEAESGDNTHHCEACNTDIKGDRSWNRHLESKRHLDNAEALAQRELAEV